MPLSHLEGGELHSILWSSKLASSSDSQDGARAAELFSPNEKTSKTHSKQPPNPTAESLFSTQSSQKHILQETKNLPLSLEANWSNTHSKSSFPKKLHQMLYDSERNGTESIVSWQPHGRAFRVNDVEKFVKNFLPKYFRQSKFTSFQRQVNLYCFRRLNIGQDRGAYYHEMFLRGQPYLCERIVRMRIKGDGIPTSVNEKCEPNFYNLLHSVLSQCLWGQQAETSIHGCLPSIQFQSYSDQQNHQQKGEQISLPTAELRSFAPLNTNMGESEAKANLHNYSFSDVYLDTAQPNDSKYAFCVTTDPAFQENQRKSEPKMIHLSSTTSSCYPDAPGRNCRVCNEPYSQSNGPAVSSLYESQVPPNTAFDCCFKGCSQVELVQVDCNDCKLAFLDNTSFTRENDAFDPFEDDDYDILSLFSMEDHIFDPSIDENKEREFVQLQEDWITDGLEEDCSLLTRQLS